MKTSTIVNTRSGSWQRYASELTQLAAQANSPILTVGEGTSDRELVWEAIRQGCQRLIVAGGDGSVSRIVNALAPAFGEVELAVLPTGTGNDLARSIGVSGDALEVAWQHAIAGTATPIDVVRTNDGAVSYFVNAATGGFGGKVSTDVDAYDKRRWGAVAYWLTAFSKLAELDPLDIRLELDDQTISLTLYGLAIANGRFVGGGYPVAPAALLNDGRIDVTTIPVLPPLELLAAGIDFTLGRHPETSPAKTFQTRQLRIHSEPIMPLSLDGEPSRAIDATFEVLPRVLPIVCGPHPLAIRAEQTASPAVALPNGTA